MLLEKKFSGETYQKEDREAKEKEDLMNLKTLLVEVVMTADLIQLAEDQNAKLSSAVVSLLTMVTIISRFVTSRMRLLIPILKTISLELSNAWELKELPYLPLLSSCSSLRLSDDQ
jgi:hypothetical protein